MVEIIELKDAHPGITIHSVFLAICNGFFEENFDLLMYMPEVMKHHEPMELI